jgi:hypothetical protein
MDPEAASCREPLAGERSVRAPAGPGLPAREVSAGRGWPAQEPREQEPPGLPSGRGGQAERPPEALQGSSAVLASAAGRASDRDSRCCRSGRGAGAPLEARRLEPAAAAPAPGALPAGQRAEGRQDGSVRPGPEAADARLAAARAPGWQGAAVVPGCPPGAAVARREPVVPDGPGWPARQREAVSAARPAGRARGGGAGLRGRRRVPVRRDLLREADADRVPRTHRGLPDPGRPACGRDRNARRVLRPVPAGADALRAAALHRPPVQPEPEPVVSPGLAGRPRHAPAAASGEGRYSRETDGKAS